MSHRAYQYGRRPPPIYEDDVDDYYQPSIRSPPLNLDDLPDSSFIDYDLGDDGDSLNEYDPSRSPTPSLRSASTGLRRATGRAGYESPIEREIPDFDASTTNRATYTWKDPLIRTKGSGNSSELPDKSSIPFYSETTNRDAFTWKDPEMKTKRRPQSDRELPPFYGETTHAATFTPKIPVRGKAVSRPEHRTNDVPFYGETSNKAHFPPKNAERTKAIKRMNTIGYDGEIATETTTKVAFPPKEASKQKSLRPKDAALFGRDTSWKTTNNGVFTPKKVNQCPAEYYMSKREKLHQVGKHYYINHSKRDDLSMPNPIQKTVGNSRQSV